MDRAGGLIWLPVDLDISEMKDAALYPPQYEYTVTGQTRKKSSTHVGHKVELNGRAIALFLYKQELFAVDAKCPHMGGPLHQGDIEDIGGNVCVSCPWHGWPFELEHGECLVSDQLRLKRYPVRQQGDEIAIGFDALDPAVFDDAEF